MRAPPADGAKLARIRERVSRPSEHMECERFWLWAKYNVRHIQPLSLLYHIPNEGQQGGHKGAMWGARLEAIGLRKDMLDYCLPTALWGYHGLYLEAKRIGEKARPGQLEWGLVLGMEGYRVDVECQGFEGLVAATLAYLHSEPDRWPSTDFHAECVRCQHMRRRVEWEWRFMSGVPNVGARSLVCASCGLPQMELPPAADYRGGK